MCLHISTSPLHSFFSQPASIYITGLALVGNPALENWNIGVHCPMEQAVRVNRTTLKPAAKAAPEQIPALLAST